MAKPSQTLQAKKGSRAQPSSALRANDDNWFSFFPLVAASISAISSFRFVWIRFVSSLVFLFCTSSSVFRRLSTISIKFY